MRVQYHFWPGEVGRDAWDVHRLIQLSAGLPVFEAAVDQIAEVDTNHWFDDEHQPTVRRVLEHIDLIEAADLSYPMILAADGRLMDGMHRVCKAILQGRPTVPAVRFEVTPPPDFRDVVPSDLPYD